MSLVSFRPPVFVGVAALGLLSGCGDGPELASVSGTVVLNGHPLADARVLFTPVDGGRPSGALTDEDGAYELTFTEDRGGALLGDHVVRISTFREGDPDSSVASAVEQIPAPYNDASELTRTVEPGSNAIHFQLVAAGPPPRGRLASQQR